jgi:hypothetical protein
VRLPYLKREQRCRPRVGNNGRNNCPSATGWWEEGDYHPSLKTYGDFPHSEATSGRQTRPTKVRSKMPTTIVNPPETPTLFIVPIPRRSRVGRTEGDGISESDLREGGRRGSKRNPLAHQCFRKERRFIAPKHTVFS